MKTLSLILICLFIQSSQLLPTTKSIIYHSDKDEKINIILHFNNPSFTIVSCGQRADTVKKEDFDKYNLSSAIIYITIDKKSVDDIYGQTDGNVTYEIK